MKKIFKSLMFLAIGAFALASCEDVPAPYIVPEEGGETEEEIQPVGTGTLEDPYNVAGVVAFINTLQADTESEQAVYIKGKVASNTTSESTITQYGNMTFTMIDEGNKSTTFTAFQVYGPGKKKFTAVTDIKVGDEVVVYGKVVNFKGTTPETVGKGAAYVYSINSESGGEGGTSSSTKEVPLSIAQAKTSNGNNYVKGYIVGYIDGTKLEEGAKFEVPTSAETEILLAETPEETDPANVFPVQLPSGVIRDALELSAHPDYLKKEVLVYGSLETYFGVTGMKSTSWGSIDGNSFGKDPDNTNIDTATPQGDGTKENPYNVAGAIKYVTELGADVTSTNEVYVKGTVKSNNTTQSNITQYGNMTFIMIDKGFENAEFQAYQVNGPGNKKFTSTSDIKVDDEVIVYGKVVNYKGNTPETTGKGSAYVYSLNGITNGDEGDDEGGNEGTTGEYMSIANLPPDITLGNYGTQLVSDESTWLSWTWNGVDFKGARICKATDANGGGIQVQCKANDDVANQGFIFNSSAWSSDIQKITIVLRVKINADPTKMFGPAYTLYAGFEAHPTTTAITPTSTTEDVDGFRIYTQVFDLANAGAKFFTIFNNLKGALYIDKIYVE